MSKYVFASLLSAVVLFTSSTPSQALQNPPRSISIGVNGIGSGVSVGGTPYGRGGFYGGQPYNPGYYGYSPRYYAPNYYTPGMYGTPRAAYYYTPDAVGGVPAEAGSPAEIEVLIPADAELFLDGAPTTQRSAKRGFVSPPLQPGRSFTYEFRARWMQDGKPVEVTRQVDVRSGAKVSVDLRQP